jgi:hypothetical protein
VDDPIRFESHTPSQQHLAEQLRRLDPALEGLYREGLVLSKRKSAPGVPYLLAHAGRELSRGVIRALSEGKAALDESAGPNHERNRTTIATIVELAPNDVVVTDWFRAHGTFADNCHYQPRPEPAGVVVSAFERLEEILFAVLAPYFLAKPELDRLLKVEHPSPADLESLKAVLARRALRQRFFQDVTSPGWLPALREWGVFDEPPNRRVLDNGWYAPPWVAGAYLPRVAGASPDGVAEILDAIPATNTNPSVWRIAVDAALVLPALHMRRVARLIKRALNAAAHSVSSRDLMRLLDRAIREQIPEVFRLADAALAIDTSERGTHGRLRHIEDFRLDQLFHTLIPALGTISGNQTLDLLIKKLRVVAQAEDPHRHPGSTRSWCPQIDQDNPRNEIPARLTHSLYAQARRLCVDAPSATAACAMLAAEPDEIFQRILIRLLADVGELVPSHVDRFIVSDDALDPPFRAAETALALRQQFGVASDAARAVFIYALERGPGLDYIAWDLRHGAVGEQPSEPIDIDETVKTWQRTRLRWFQDQLPAELQALAARVGVEPKALSPREQSLAETGMYVGPVSFVVPRYGSPRTLDELRATPMEELVTFLQEWTPPASSSPFGSEEPTIDGLANVLIELVSSEPATMASLIDRATTSDLAPEYLRAIAKGIAKSVAAGTEVSWQSVFKYVTAIVTKAFTVIGDPPVIDKTTQPWVWAAREGLTLVNYAARENRMDAANVPAAWEALGVAINVGRRFDGETEIESADALESAAVNRFSGEAVDGLIEMGLAERRRLGADAPGAVFTQLLDSVVAEDTKPGLAVLGRLLPYAVLVADQWVQESIRPLTDGRNLMNPTECPLWAGYLLGQHFDPRTFEMLRPVYHAAAMCVDPSVASVRRGSLTEHLAQHVVLVMMHGIAAGDDADKLVRTILDRVPVVDRKQAYWLIYRSIGDMEGTDADIVTPRVLAFWEWRLGCLEALDPTDPQRAEEATGLTWLIFATRLPAAAALPLARRTVALSAGKLVIDNQIWDRAVEFSAIDPVAAYEFARPIVLATLKSDYVDLLEIPLKQVLGNALKSGNAGTVSDATSLIHFLGERGFDAFGELLAKSSEGPTAAGTSPAIE